jgi:uncharacterized metal-binding protein YceD (DUF177 family)
MGNPLRDRRTASDLASSGQVIEFTEKLGDFKRLAGIVRADLDRLDPDTLPRNWRDATVTGRLSFGFADAQERLAALEGRVAATIDAVCQRCLAPMQLPLVVELKLVFAPGASAMEGRGYEVWELDEADLRPVDLVEETLIMALPLVATHGGEESCDGAPATAGDAAETVRPFASLKERMAGQE